MSVITNVPDPNLWNEICKSLAAQRPPFRDDDTASVTTVYQDFSPAKHNPVFYGKMHKRISGVDCDALTEVDPSKCHPSIAGYALVDNPPKTPPPSPPAPPPHITCSPREYLESYVFPLLLPALEEMLKQAKLERCFERKRTKFNGLDFLTEYLYARNPAHTDRDIKTLGDIPFVTEHWEKFPRPPLPMSLLWTEAEASLIIQAFWRGYKVRCDPGIQELRQWQREWQEENANINRKVSDFWAQQMPDGEEAESIEGSQVAADEEKATPREASEVRSSCGASPTDDQDSVPQEAEKEEQTQSMGGDMETVTQADLNGDIEQNDTEQNDKGSAGDE